MIEIGPVLNATDAPSESANTLVPSNLSNDTRVTTDTLASSPTYDEMSVDCEPAKQEVSSEPAVSMDYVGKQTDSSMNETFQDENGELCSAV